MNFKVKDKVVVIAGREKGKQGKISQILKKEDKVIIEGVNMIKKHIKPNGQNETGGIVEVEAPIHASNIMHIDSKTNTRTRITNSVDKNGKKVRLTKKSNEKID